MASLSIAIQVSSTNGGMTTQGAFNRTYTPAGNNQTANVQTTSTSAALVAVGNLTTYGGYFFLQNLSATTGEDINIYQDGASGAVLIGVLKAGVTADGDTVGQAMLFKPAAAIGCKSAAGTPDLLILAYEP